MKKQKKEIKKILIVCTTDSMIWNFLVPHIKMLEKNGYYVECACSITGDFYKKIVDEYKIKMNEIPFQRSPYKLSNLRAYKALCMLIKEKNFDTIFCHEPVGGAIGRIAGHKCKCNVIYMAHGFHFFKGAPKSRFLYYVVEKYLAHYTDILITINQEDYEAALNFKGPKCYKIHGIGVSTTKFTTDNAYNCYLDKEFNIPSDAIKILSVGELIPRKNHEVIIRALENLKEYNVFYFIAGDGELKQYLQKLIDNLGLNSKVFLLGYRTDISALCNSVDIFALPSVHEGLSVALMEAMGCGKPVIASKIRGNIDLIDEEKGGYLVSTYDVKGYTCAIETLASSRRKCSKYGEYNKIRVKDFDIECVKKELLEIFDENRRS